MTEPQTIATALTAQLVINQIFRDQLTIQARLPKNPPPRKPGESISMGYNDLEKHQVFFSLIFIIAPFEIKGLVSLHKHIIDREPLPPGSLDTLKRTCDIARENISLFEKIQAVEPDDTEFACYEIHPDNSTSRKNNRSGKYEGQRFTNDDLFRYCDSVEDLISSCLPAEAPPAKDQKVKPDNTFISHLTMDEDKKQPFADQLKNKYSDLTGKDLAIVFYAAKEHIRLKNLSSLLHDWQQYIGRCTLRDEAMNKAMRKLKDNESISNPAMKSYISELTAKQTEILNIYQSIE